MASTAGIPRQPIAEAPYDVVAAHAPVDMHGRRNLSEYGVQVVTDALSAAGVECGPYDERIREWLGRFDATTAVTVASWLLRAHEAGQARGTFDAAEH